MRIRIRRNRRPELWKGIAAGLAGGLAGSWAMGVFHQMVSNRSGQGREEDSTVKAASAVSESVLRHRLTDGEKKWAGPAVHYAFGAVMGGIYGGLAERIPGAHPALGAPFGAAVYGGAHAGAVPALGLSKPLTRSSVREEAPEFAAHLVYGLTVGVVSRIARAAI